MLGDRTDALIKDLVTRELKWDSHVAETEIGVEVKDGVVTLSGIVDAWGKRAAAVKAAHRVAGVRDVADEIEVQYRCAAQRTDADIAGAVRKTLEWDVFVPDQRITSTVAKGVVTLEGTVDRYTQKKDAERAIRNIIGVRDVRNDITVTARADAAEVKAAIEQALERHASREAQHIEASVHDGQVTLTGKVGSPAERRAAVGAAYGTSGVWHVHDRLEVTWR